MQRLRDGLTMWSRVHYALWRLGGMRREVHLRLINGVRFVVRPAPTLDLDVAREVFTLGVYRTYAGWLVPPIKTIVDLGSNVGFSVLDLLSQHADAHAIAFEPHPLHVTQIRKQLSQNGLLDRVTIHQVAAGTFDGHASLSDAGPLSQVSTVQTSLGIGVQVRDFFTMMAEKPIDLLKLDIEGGEWALLEDARMRLLKPRNLVLEWHADNAGHDSAWLASRLSELGYEYRSASQDSISTGIFWARTIG